MTVGLTLNETASAHYLSGCRFGVVDDLTGEGVVFSVRRSDPNYPSCEQAKCSNLLCKVETKRSPEMLSCARNLEDWRKVFNGNKDYITLTPVRTRASCS